MSFKTSKPEETISALSDAADAIEECVGRAFVVLRDLRGSFAAPFDTSWLPNKIAELRAAAGNMAEALRAYGTLSGADSASKIALEDLARSLQALSQDHELEPALAAIIKPLMMKSSAPLSRLAGTTQLRDEADQRLAHIQTGLARLHEVGTDIRLVISCVLGEQTNGVAKSINDLRQTVASACASLSALVEVQQSSLAALPSATHCGFSTLQAAAADFDAPVEWTTMRAMAKALREQEADPATQAARTQLDTAAERVARLLLEIEAPFAERLEGAFNRIEDLIRITDGLEPIANELVWIAEQIVPPNKSPDLPADTDGLQDGPEITALWDLYTMDAEREIHRSTLRKLSR